MTDYYDNVSFVRGKLRATGGAAARYVIGDAWNERNIKVVGATILLMSRDPTHHLYTL
jgi:hypothetical protein